MAESALVLCGGQSTRMGRDKSALPFGDGDTLLTRAIAIASAVASTVVVAGRPGPQVPAGIRVIADAVPAAGPLAALAGALPALPEGRMILLSCDAPLVVPALLRLLLDRLADTGADACVPMIDGVPMPTCAAYATRVHAHAARLVASGERSLRALLDAIAVEWMSADEVRRVDADLVSFWDCDTPAEYRAALARDASARRR